MLRFSLHLIIIIFLPFSCFSEEVLNSNNNIKIIFGSCSNQNISMPHWEYINSYKPNYLMLLGDNVYGDFNDYEAKSLLSAYSKLNLIIYFFHLGN